mgnify:CR=1 FL=1
MLQSCEAAGAAAVRTATGALGTGRGAGAEPCAGQRGLNFSPATHPPVLRWRVAWLDAWP